MRSGWIELLIVVGVVTGCVSRTPAPVGQEPKLMESDAATKDGSSIYDTAMGLLSEGRQVEAELLVVEKCETYPESQRLWFLRGVLERSRFDKSKSRESLSRAYALGTGTIPGIASSATVVMDMGLMVESGFRMLRELIAANPDEILVRWLFAIECREHGRRSQEALEQIEFIIQQWRIAPATVHHIHAEILSEELMLPEKAIVHRVRASELEPTAWSFHGLAHAQMELGRFEEADKAFAQLLELDPDDPDHWVQWGICLYAMGEYSAAAGKFEQAWNLDHYDSSNLLYWGNTLQKLGRLREGFKKYAEVVEQDPTHREGCRLIVLSKLYGYGTRPDARWALELSSDAEPDAAVKPWKKVALCVQVNDGRTGPVPPERSSVLLDHLKTLAEEGNAYAQFNLGMIYYHGIGVPMDGNAALTWLGRAAANGHAEARRVLDTMQLIRAAP